jgi:Omp85 superfamily domain
MPASTTSRLSLFVWLLVFAGIVPARAQETPTPASPPQAPGYWPEPPIVGKAADYAGERLLPSSGPPHDGFYPELGQMITGSGWISVGPGYRHKFADSRGLAESSAAISWRSYKIAQARVEFHAVGEDTLTVGGQEMYQDLAQIRFFGSGPHSVSTNRGMYRMRDFDTVGYVRYKINPLVIRATVGWLDKPTISSGAGWFRSGYTDARVLFGDAGAPGLADPASFLHSDVSAAIDTRDEAQHGTRGGFYRADFAVYSDRDRGKYSFQRYEAEAVQFVPLTPSRNWVLALHGWLVGSDTSNGDVIPIYMLPSLGGHNTLRGYTDFRFHDRDMLVANVESRWAIWEHLDAAVFFDAGNVAPRVGDLNLSKTSVGVGLRVHTRTGTLGRLDLGHSKEGWHIFFKMDDPFGLSRLSRRIAPVPVVP